MRMDRIRSWQGEVCKHCGQPNHIGYTINDDIWKEALPEELYDSVVCLGCFDWFAWKKGIKNYISFIRLLYYTGRNDTAVFEQKSNNYGERAR